MIRSVMMTLTTLVLMTIIIITIVVICSHHCYNHEPHPHPRAGLGTRLGKTNVRLARLGKGTPWLRNRKKVGHADQVWVCSHKRSPRPSKWSLASPRVWHLGNMLAGGVGQCNRAQAAQESSWMHLGRKHGLTCPNDLSTPLEAHLAPHQSSRTFLVEALSEV